MEATLYLFVDKEEPELLEMYKKQIKEHNEQMDKIHFQILDLTFYYHKKLRFHIKIMIHILLISK